MKFHLNKKGVAPLLIILGVLLVGGALFGLNRAGILSIPGTATPTDDTAEGPLIYSGTESNSFKCPDNVDYCKVDFEATFDEIIGDVKLVFRNCNCKIDQYAYRYDENNEPCYVFAFFENAVGYKVLKSQSAVVTTVKPPQHTMVYPTPEGFSTTAFYANSDYWIRVHSPIENNNYYVSTLREFTNTDVIPFECNSNQILDPVKESYTGSYSIGGYMNICPSGDVNYPNCGSREEIDSRQNVFTKQVSIDMVGGDTVTFNPRDVEDNSLDISKYQIKVTKYVDCQERECTLGDTFCLANEYDTSSGIKTTHDFDSKADCLESGCTNCQEGISGKFSCLDRSLNFALIQKCDGLDERGCPSFDTYDKCLTGQKCYVDDELKEGIGGCGCPDDECVLGETIKQSINTYQICEPRGSCNELSGTRTCAGGLIFDETGRGGRGDCVCPDSDCDSATESWCLSPVEMQECEQNTWQGIEASKTCFQKQSSVSQSPDYEGQVECKKDSGDVSAHWECIEDSGCTSVNGRRCNSNNDNYEICSCRNLEGLGSLCLGTSTEGCLSWESQGQRDECCVYDSDCDTGDPAYIHSCNQISHACEHERNDDYCSNDNDCLEYEQCSSNSCVPKTTGNYCSIEQVGNTKCDPNDLTKVKVQQCEKIIGTQAYEWKIKKECFSSSVNPDNYKCSYLSQTSSDCKCKNEPVDQDNLYSCKSNVLYKLETDSNGCKYQSSEGLKNECCLVDNDCNTGDPAYIHSCNQVNHECEHDRNNDYCIDNNECLEYEQCVSHSCVPKTTGTYCQYSQVGNARCDPNDSTGLKIQRCEKMSGTNVYSWNFNKECSSSSVNPDSYKCSYIDQTKAECDCFVEPIGNLGNYKCEGNDLYLLDSDSNGCKYLKYIDTKETGCCLLDGQCDNREGYFKSCTSSNECRYDLISGYCGSTVPCPQPYVCRDNQCGVPNPNEIYCAESIKDEMACRSNPDYKYVCKLDSSSGTGNLPDIYKWEDIECESPQTCFDGDCDCPFDLEYCTYGTTPKCSSDKTTKKECTTPFGSCYKWTPTLCGDPKTCDNGQCKCPTPDEDSKYCLRSELNEDKCLDLFTVAVCQEVNGCPKWVPQPTCGVGQICVKNSPATCSYPIDEIIILPKPSYAVGEGIDDVKIVVTSEQFSGQTLYVSGILQGEFEQRKDTWTNNEGHATLNFGNESGLTKTGQFMLLVQVCNKAPSIDKSEICKLKNATITVKKTLEIRMSTPFSSIVAREVKLTYSVVDKETPTLILGVIPNIEVSQGTNMLDFVTEGTNTIKFTPLSVGNVVIKLTAEKDNYISDSESVTLEVVYPERKTNVKFNGEKLIDVLDKIKTGKHTITIQVDKSGEVLEIYKPQVKMETPDGEIVDMLWVEQPDASWKSTYTLVEEGKTYVLEGTISFKDLSEASETISYTITTAGNIGTGKTASAPTLIWAGVGVGVLVMVLIIVVLMKGKKK